jgi:hypothetical protein
MTKISEFDYHCGNSISITTQDGFELWMSIESEIILLSGATAVTEPCVNPGQRSRL